MTHHRLPRSAGGDAGESRTWLCTDPGMLSVDSAFASLAEDEGPLDLSPEAYVSTVVGDFSLTRSCSGRTGKAVE